MTRDKLLKLLHDIDERCIAVSGGDVETPLTEAIAWLEDEGNKEKMFTFDGVGYPFAGWVLR